MTDNRLAEADRKVRHGGVPVEQAGKIWRITGIKSFKDEGGNFKLDASVDGQPVKFLQNGLESVYRLPVLPVTTRARVFRVRWRREICLAGMPYRIECA